MTDITNQIPVSEIKASIEARIETRFDNCHKPKNEKAYFFSISTAKSAFQTGSLLRGTSDLSPLEEWLIIQLYEEKTLPKLSGVVNGTRSKLFESVLKEAKERREIEMRQTKPLPACNFIGQTGRNIVSPIDDYIKK